MSTRKQENLQVDCN